MVVEERKDQGPETDSAQFRLSRDMSLRRGTITSHETSEERQSSSTASIFYVVTVSNENPSTRCWVCVETLTYTPYSVSYHL
jgi:hypothetical protein